MKLINTETGTISEVVYFKQNNGEVLAENVNEVLASGNFEILIEED